MYKMFLTFLLFFILLGLYIFINLGKFVDVSSKPIKSEIIVSLGGDPSGYRLKKALEIYKQGYSNSGKILYTSYDGVSKSLDKSGSREQYLQHQGVLKQDIIQVRSKMVSNTMEEVLFIKKYMLFHHYRSVLIVSHTPHTRRIQTFAKYFAQYEDSGLVLHIASYQPKWWNAENYYENKISFKATLLEVEKLVYNILKYNPLMIKYTHYFKANKEGMWDNEIRNNLR